MLLASCCEMHHWRLCHESVLPWWSLRHTGHQYPKRYICICQRSHFIPTIILDSDSWWILDMQIPSETHQFQLGLVTMQLCSEVPPYRLWWNAWASAAPDGARASTTKTRLDEEMNEWVMLGSRKSGWLMWETHTHKPPILDALYMFIHVFTCLYMFIHVYTRLYMFIHVYTIYYPFIAL